MSTTSKLFKPLKIGAQTLENRVVMAPLTRFRADDNHVPHPYVAEYYAQRASTRGTLLITEATLVSSKAGSYPHVPGIYSQEQISSWRKVVDRVHKAGGVIYLQLWALGRTDNAQARNAAGSGDLLSASDIAMDDQHGKPREMTEQEIQGAIADYATGAKNAVEGAGFDGVEIHGANGYLVDQFIQDVSNKRTDKWGGSIENRAQFATEVVKAVAAAVGADKTAIRLSPFSDFQGMKMQDPLPQFSRVLENIKPLGLAYIHLVESRVSGSSDREPSASIDPYLKVWGKASPVLLAGGFKPETALKAVDEDHADSDIAVVFGRIFIANPDLVYRIKNDIKLNPYNRDTFYTPEKTAGYIDYPFSEEWQREHGTVQA